jgi:hypothetical protein
MYIFILPWYNMKRFLTLSLIAILFSATQLLYATDFEVVPASTWNQTTLGNTVDCVAGTKPGTDWACTKIQGKTVRDRYNKVANNSSLGDQFATGIFSWNWVLEYIVYIVKFISEAGILVGAWMIIVAWYKYASAVFTGQTPSMKDVGNAIKWVLVIIFAYAIIRALTAAFL